MIKIRWWYFVLLGGFVALVLWANVSAGATDHPIPPVYAYDLATKSWFIAPGGTSWPCRAPSGDNTGVEVVMAQAPDGKLIPVLLSKNEIQTGKSVTIEGIAQQRSTLRRMICDPESQSWVDEGSKAGASLFAKIQALSSKGYKMDVRPAPKP